MKSRILILVLVAVAIAQTVAFYLLVQSEADRAVVRLANIAALLAQAEPNRLSRRQQSTLIVLADSEVVWLSKLPLVLFKRDIARAFETGKAMFAEPRRRFAREHGAVPQYVLPEEAEAYLAEWNKLQILMEQAAERLKVGR